MAPGGDLRGRAIAAAAFFATPDLDQWLAGGASPHGVALGEAALRALWSTALAALAVFARR
ncbi:MAG TPA: hypothetical protein VNF74_00745 [Terriglobales bacterium]|nr:hypothetical protein [Terriglobales bacterium]